MKVDYSSSPFYTDAKRMYGTKMTALAKMNVILEKYAAEGRTPITVRALWYQMVVGGLANNVKNRNWVGNIVHFGRVLGLIDWNHISDPGRDYYAFGEMEKPSDAIDPDAYQVDWWEGQETFPEVWVEKAAQLGTLERVCSRYRVPFCSSRGFDSTTALHVAGDRIARRLRNSGRGTALLYLGDHDYSGFLIDRAIEKDVSTYAGFHVPVVRLGLTWEQAHTLGKNGGELPANIVDAKKDAKNQHRFQYRAKFGDDAPQWEMDALAPDVIEKLIETAIDTYILDHAAWRARQEFEEEGRNRLRRVVEDLVKELER